jgi:hypothetical protein
MVFEIRVYHGRIAVFHETIGNQQYVISHYRITFLTCVLEVLALGFRF